LCDLNISMFVAVNFVTFNPVNCETAIVESVRNRPATSTRTANQMKDLPYPIPSVGFAGRNLSRPAVRQRVDAKVKSGRINLIGFEL